jgi:hypothetical protein
MAPGCKPGGLTPYVGSNPTPCTKAIADFQLSIVNWLPSDSDAFQSAIENWQLAMVERV